MDTSFSRRSFLTGALTAGAAIAGTGLVGCAPAKASSAEQDVQAGANAGEPSFMTAPEPIADSEIIDTIDTQVLVIGAGYSGLAAALSAKDEGLEVLIAEKTTSAQGRGAGTGVINSTYAVNHDAAVTDKPSAAFRWSQTCGNRINENLVGMFFEESGPAMDWLLEKAEQGGYKLKIDLWDGYSRNPLLPDEAGYHMLSLDEGASGVADFDQTKFFTVELLAKLADAAGIDFMFESPAEQLVKEGDKVIGAVLKTADGYKKVVASKGVVLATGDIAGDEEMLDYYCPVAKKAQAIYTPVGANTGDGHKMALWAGGAMQEAPFPPMLHPQRYADKSSNELEGPFLYVNPQGERFFNEGTWVQPRSLQIMMNTEEGIAYSVFDANWPADLMSSFPYGGGMFWDSFRYKESSTYADTITYYQKSLQENIEAGTAFEANTIEELAEKMGVPAEQFKKTVERYNGLCEKKDDTDFHKRSELLYPLKQGPFYANSVGACLLVVVGGAKVDENLQVLSTDGNPIEGLYAVGNVSGDLYAVDYPINVPGCSHGRCLTWGYIVGKVLAGTWDRP